MAEAESPLDIEAESLNELDEETLLKIGLKEVTMGASSDAKIQIVQFESAGVWASMSMTFDFSAFTGSLPVTEIVNKIVVPTRNSFVRFAHPETMARIEELRALIEGIRDGESISTIEKNVHKARKGFVNTFKSTFEVKRQVEPPQE